LDNKKYIRASLYYEAKKRAKERGIEFNISKEDIDVPDTCPILGIPLVKHTKVFGRDSPSLDRRDPTKGYIVGNIGVIAWAANNVKNNLTIEQVEALLKYMKGEL
jgi:hypothetical protein